MTTFSQLVDAMVLESRRPDLQTEICAYTNQTLRDLHINPDTNTPVFYKDNYNESQLTATADTGFSWTIPNPQTFQGMNPAQFLSIGCKPVWAFERPVGKNMIPCDPWMYRGGSTVIFNGYGCTGSLINFSWYEYTRALKYRVPAVRECSWDIDEGFTYNPTTTDPVVQAQYQALCTNWILQRWEDLVTEGVRAKIYKRLSDQGRAQTAYSMYQQGRKAIVANESAQPNGAF